MNNDELVDSLIRQGALKTPQIINAFRIVDRRNFVPKDLVKYAYVDEPLPIGRGQTISQPYTVAVMTEALEPRKGHKVLEIGTGSGYQAAILSRIVSPGKVVTVEIDPILHEAAKERLKRYENVIPILSDGSEGYEPESPYDRIIITCESPKFPKVIYSQLKKGGIMVVPIGMEMWKIIKGEKPIKKFIGFYIFSSMRGREGYK